MMMNGNDMDEVVGRIETSKNFCWERKTNCDSDENSNG